MGRAGGRLVAGKVLRLASGTDPSDRLERDGSVPAPLGFSESAEIVGRGLGCPSPGRDMDVAGSW